jgi:hypothetical protein
VEKFVQKAGNIFASDSSQDASALCTEARAGTFVVQLLTNSLGKVCVIGAERFVFYFDFWLPTFYF